MILAIFVVFFIWFFPKAFRGLRRMFRAVGRFLHGEGFRDPAVR